MVKALNNKQRESVRAIHEALSYLAVDARDAGAEELLFHIGLAMHTAQDFLNDAQHQANKADA